MALRCLAVAQCLDVHGQSRWILASLARLPHLGVSVRIRSATWRWRRRRRDAPHTDNLCRDAGVLEHVVEGLVQRFHDRRRSPCGCHDAKPGADVETRQPGFRNRRYVGERRCSLGRRNTQGPELPTLMKLHPGEHVAKDNGHLPRNAIIDSESIALVRHMCHMDTGQLVHQFAREMRTRPDAARSEAVFGGFPPDLRHELCHVPGGKTGVDGQHGRREIDHSHRRKILDRIVGKFAEYADVCRRLLRGCQR
jgi:hypothetical protein